MPLRTRHYRNTVTGSCCLGLLLVAAGCGVTLTQADCETLLAPYDVENLTIGQSESGQSTCEGTVDDFSVVAEIELQEDVFRIRQARVAEDDPVPPSELREEIAQERLGRAAREIGKEAAGVLERAVKGLLDEN